MYIHVCMYYIWDNALTVCGGGWYSIESAVAEVCEDFVFDVGAQARRPRRCWRRSSSCGPPLLSECLRKVCVVTNESNLSPDNYVCIYVCLCMWARRGLHGGGLQGDGSHQQAPAHSAALQPNLQGRVHGRGCLHLDRR